MSTTANQRRPGSTSTSSASSAAAPGVAAKRASFDASLRNLQSRLGATGGASTPSSSTATPAPAPTPSTATTAPATGSVREADAAANVAALSSEGAALIERISNFDLFAATRRAPAGAHRPTPPPAVLSTAHAAAAAAVTAAAGAGMLPTRDSGAGGGLISCAAKGRGNNDETAVAHSVDVAKFSSNAVAGGEAARAAHAITVAVGGGDVRGTKPGDAAPRASATSATSSSATTTTRPANAAEPAPPVRNFRANEQFMHELRQTAESLERFTYFEALTKAIIQEQQCRP